MSNEKNTEIYSNEGLDSSENRDLQILSKRNKLGRLAAGAALIGVIGAGAAEMMPNDHPNPELELLEYDAVPNQGTYYGVQRAFENADNDGDGFSNVNDGFEPYSAARASDLSGKEVTRVMPGDVMLLGEWHYDPGDAESYANAIRNSGRAWVAEGAVAIDRDGTIFRDVIFDGVNAYRTNFAKDDYVDLSKLELTKIDTDSIHIKDGGLYYHTVEILSTLPEKDAEYDPNFPQPYRDSNIYRYSAIEDGGSFTIGEDWSEIKIEEILENYEPNLPFSNYPNSSNDPADTNNVQEKDYDNPESESS